MRHMPLFASIVAPCRSPHHAALRHVHMPLFANTHAFRHLGVLSTFDVRERARVFSLSLTPTLTLSPSLPPSHSRSCSDSHPLTLAHRGGDDAAGGHLTRVISWLASAKTRRCRSGDDAAGSRALLRSWSHFFCGIGAIAEGATMLRLYHETLLGAKRCVEIGSRPLKRGVSWVVSANTRRSRGGYDFSSSSLLVSSLELSDIQVYEP